MSVKIEILDYKYKTIELAQMNTDTSFNNPSSWTILPLGSWVITGTAGSGADKINGTGAGYISHSMTFVEGKKYRIKYKISGLTTNGQLILANHLAGNANGFVTNTNGTFSYDWIQGSNNLTSLVLYASSSFDGTVEYALVYPLSDIDWDNSVVGELDVTDHSDFPLALTFQISDFKDLTSTSGDYSKTFKIPATKNNNKIFKHLYNPNSDTENKVTDKKPCRIQFNNLYSLVGLIQVNGVGGYGEKPSYYNCVFFGSNLSWANKLQESDMNDIDWGSYGDGLTYNKDSIVATWQHTDSDNASNSPIVYPITSYGEYNPEGTSDTIQLLDTAYDVGTGSSAALGYNGFYDSKTSYGTPPPASDWRPSIFVKQTLDKIFSQIGGSNGLGYKISSAFMQTDMFKKLVWLLPNFKYNNSEERAIKYWYGNHFVGQGAIQTNSLSTASTTAVFDKFTVNLNKAGADFVLNTNTENTGWDTSTATEGGFFTVQEYGYYNVKIENFAFYWDNWTPTIYTTYVEYSSLRLQVQTVGQNSWNTIATAVTPGFSVSSSSAHSGVLPVPDIDHDVFLNKGDKLRLRVITKFRNSHSNAAGSFDLHTFGAASPTSASTSTNPNGKYNIELMVDKVAYGQTYNLKDVISPEYSQVDFIKGIAHAFNLQMTTDESTRTVNIEPFNAFYKPYSDAIDWTYKLDRSSEVSDKWLESDLNRTLVFKYKSDSEDAKVKYRGEEFFHDIDDEYPYREILPDTFKKGDSTFENPFFAGTYSSKDQETVGSPIVDTAYSSCLWTENVSSADTARPVKGYEFLPRLLYWNQYSPANGNGNKIAKLQTWGSVFKYIIADASSGTSYLSNIYPQATMVNRDSTTSPNLAYGSAWVRDYNDATQVYTGYQSGKGLYDTYYKYMIEMLKLKPRLRTVYVDLNISDIVNLDFTKLVYIDGAYWRINKISDYMPSQIKSTKVELIEWLELGVFAATLPSPQAPIFNEDEHFQQAPRLV